MCKWGKLSWFVKREKGLKGRRMDNYIREEMLKRVQKSIRQGRENRVSLLPETTSLLLRLLSQNITNLIISIIILVVSNLKLQGRSLEFYFDSCPLLLQWRRVNLNGASRKSQSLFSVYKVCLVGLTKISHPLCFLNSWYNELTNTISSRWYRNLQ